MSTKSRFSFLLTAAFVLGASAAALAAVSPDSISETPWEAAGDFPIIQGNQKTASCKGEAYTFIDAEQVRRQSDLSVLSCSALAKTACSCAQMQKTLAVKKNSLAEAPAANGNSAAKGIARSGIIAFNDANTVAGSLSAEFLTLNKAPAVEKESPPPSLAPRAAAAFMTEYPSQNISGTRSVSTLFSGASGETFPSIGTGAAKALGTTQNQGQDLNQQ